MINLLLLIMGIGAIWLFFEFPEFAIIMIFVVIFAGMCSSSEVTVTTEEVTQTDDHRIKNPDGTPVRPSNDQIGHYSNAGSSSETNTGTVVEDSIVEQCIDGIVYILVTKSGQNFMSPKEDTFGYNEKCSN